MKIVLSAVETELYNAWQQLCGDLEFVEVHRGSILSLSCDAVVSPANSFGFMDGGIDMLYSSFFGWQIQEKLQKQIREKHFGELLIGQAEIIETNKPQIPFVISAPTMRVPMILQNSVNAYLAARAVLLLIKHGTFTSGNYKGGKISDFVESIAFPGLGTGVGRIEPNVCARQVRAAIETVILDKTEFPFSWADAQEKHQQLYTNRVRDLQYE